MRARLTAEGGDCQPPSVDLSPGQTVTLGRSRDNTLVLRDELASRLHAKVYFEDGRWHVRDFGLNGTKLDGLKVSGAVELADGKVIKIGEVVLRFNIDMFNVFNHPNNPTSVGGDGVLSTRNSGSGARTTQLSLRLQW